MTGLVSTASRMITEVNQQDRKAWAARTEEMAKALRDEILHADTGAAMRGLLAEQVTLIKSIPLEAAQRVHELTLQRLKIIESMPDLPQGERRKQTDRAIDGAFKDAPDFGGIDASIGGPAGELMKIDDAQEELEDWYETQMELLAKFREDRADLNSEWDEQELETKRQHEEALANLEQSRQLVALSAAESTFGSLAEMARTFAGEQSGLYKAMFIAEKTAAIARSTIAIQEGIALAAANPFPLNLAAMATVAAATAGIVGNIAAIGMAHDGIDSVPQTGTWLLEKGERVTTASTSAKLDKTLSDIQAGRTQSGHTAPNQTFNMTFPGITDSREAKRSTAQAARQFAQVSQNSTRYT